MSVPEGFRFHTPDDPLDERARWALTRIFKLAPAVVDDLLADPDRRTLMRVADDGTLAGFVVFKDYKNVLLAPDNAFIARDDKELLAAPGLKVYSFEQIWYRDGDFDMERIVREVLPAMSEVLAGEALRHALVCLLPQGDGTRRLREILEELGFRLNPNVYCDYRLPMSQVPAVADDLPDAPEGLDLRSFEDAPEPALLADTFNRIFSGGEQVIDGAMVEAMLALPSFARDLSMWVARDGRVAGFVWLYRSSPTVAKLSLVGTDPDFRGQGLVLRCTPMLMRALERAGIEALTFTIQGDNKEPARIATALGVAPYQRRQTYIRAR